MKSLTVRSRTAAVGALALGAWLVPHGAADAAAYRAHWGFDETAGTTAFDDSGNRNDGANQEVVGDGSGYRFNGVDSAVIVNDSASLDPGSTDFSFGVTLTTTLPIAGTDYDLLRKGLTTTAGGEYKVEVLNVNGVAKAFCLVKDANKHVASIRWSPAGGIADGKQHTITCSKTSNGVTLTLDSYTPRTKTNANGIGSIANSSPLYIGTKSASGGDQFEGTIFDAHIL